MLSAPFSMVALIVSKREERMLSSCPVAEPSVFVSEEMWLESVFSMDFEPV